MHNCATVICDTPAKWFGMNLLVVVSVVAEAPDSGAVGPWNELHQSGGLRVVPSARWWDGGSRAGIRHGFSGAIPSQGIG